MSSIAKAVRSIRRVGIAGTGNFVEMQESERARIARELHDSLGQKVALLQMDLDQIGRSLPSSEQAKLHPLSAHVADIARELHEVSHDLHPLKLEILGLEKSIEALCQECSRQSGVSITFLRNGDLPHPIGSSESLCLYRVAQEALHNVVKHSKAARASVHLVGIRNTLGLVVADTGQGFDKSVVTTGLGLASMRQRVQLLNGTIAVHTRLGGGTRIYVRIPFRREAKKDRSALRCRSNRHAVLRTCQAPAGA